MNAGDSDATYGSTGGPQDGQFKPIPVEGGSPSGALAQPAKTEFEARREARRKQMNGLLAISGGLATIAFLIIGFVFSGWAWAWIVFMIPGLLRTYLARSE